MAIVSPEGQIYDSVAGDYDIIWNVPAVKILFPLLDSNLKRLGPWDGKLAVDFACGTGIGLRLMKKLGATKLVGVDISNEMLEVAKMTSPDAGFELHHADCSQPLDHLGMPNEGFDLVLAMWLLNYSESREMMEGMWRNIAAYLKPGSGKFVGIIQIQETFNPKSMQGKMAEFGARETNVKPLDTGEGGRMHIEFDTQPKIEFDTYVLKKEILEQWKENEGMRAGDEVKGDVDGKSEEW